jgi:hypothetical protein
MRILNIIEVTEDMSEEIKLLAEIYNLIGSIRSQDFTNQELDSEMYKIYRKVDIYFCNKNYL